MKDSSKHSVEEKKQHLAKTIALNLGIPVINYSTEEDKESLAKIIKGSLGLPVIRNILGDGVSRYASLNKLEDKNADIQSFRNRIQAFTSRYAIRGMDEEKQNKLIDEDKKSEPHDEEERNNKINAIKAELALKTAQIQQLMEEEERKDALIRKEGVDKTRSAVDDASRATEEAKDADKDAGKYRLLSSLVFFGILDVLDILSVALSHFGEVDEKFYEAVGDVLRDEKVMSFFAEVNKVFKIDWLGEKVSQLPILKEINQSATDFLTGPYLGSFTSIGNDLLASDPAEFALKIAVLTWTINNEVGISNNYEVANEKTTKARDECKIELNDKYSQVKLAKRAEYIIAKETENELKIIYINAGKRLAKDLKYLKEDLKEDLKADLRAIEIKHNGSTNALDFFEKNDSSEINKYLTDNVKDAQRLASIAMKHREIFKDDKEANVKREELLRQSLNGLKLTAIKNGLMRMGDDKAKDIGKGIEVDSGNDYNEREWVIKQVIEEMGNKNGDEVIMALAKLAQRDEKIELIRIGHREERSEGKTESVNVVGSAPLADPSLGRLPTSTHLVSDKNCGPQAAGVFTVTPPAIAGRV